MLVYPIEWKAPADRGDYPHMAKLDAVLWERFLDVYGPNFLRFAYDVALGGFLPGEQSGTIDERKGWQYSTALKIDAIGERLDDVLVIEVKPHAGVSAIGGALSYTTLLSVEPPVLKPLVATIVTDYVSPDIRFVAEAFQVLVIELDKRP